MSMHFFDVLLDRQHHSCCIFPNVGKTTVVPPTQGKGNDWVLILEEVK